MLCNMLGAYADANGNATCTMSDEVCKDQDDDDGDGGSGECVVEPVDEKIRRQMYAVMLYIPVSLVSKLFSFLHVFTIDQK